ALSHGLRLPRHARRERRSTRGTRILGARIPERGRSNEQEDAPARHATRAPPPPAPRQEIRASNRPGRAARGMTRAYVGLGANLGEPRRQLTEAIIAMSGLPETRLAGHSSFYRTAPVGYENQPEFLNAVAALDTRLAPGVLLEGLQGIE